MAHAPLLQLVGHGQARLAATEDDHLNPLNRFHALISLSGLQFCCSHWMEDVKPPAGVP